MKTEVQFSFEEVVSRFAGSKIATISLSDEVLSIGMDNGRCLELLDNGQQCCEVRYMRTDDDLPYFVGAEIIGIEIRDVPGHKICDDGDYKDVQFLVVHTDKGDLTTQNYNEHNGYYGGFEIEAKTDNITPEEFDALMVECNAGKHRMLDYGSYKCCSVCDKD